MRLKERIRRNKHSFRIAWELVEAGFGPQLRTTCPWHPKKKRGSLYRRGDDWVCIYCGRGFSHYDGRYLQPIDPRVLEEVGTILCPPPTGFRMVGNPETFDQGIVRL